MTPYRLPPDWNSLTLGQLTESTRPICYGVLKPGESDDEGVPLVRVTDISSNQFDDSHLMRIKPSLDEEFRRSRLKGGELLLSIQGTIGRVAICPPRYSGANISRTIAVIEPDGRVDRRFIYFFLRYLGDTSAFHTVGTTRSSLNIETLRRVSVPIPPLPEQRRIAEILDKADALRAKRRTALAQLDTLTQSIFLAMFGDPATNPKGWPLMKLEDLFDIARGGSPRPIDAFITEAEDGINWILIGDAPEGGKYITKTKKRIKPEGASRSRAVKPGDFLLTNSMSFGRPYIMRTSGCIHDGWLVLSPRAEDFEPDYFYMLLGSRAVFIEFERLAPGATVKNLNIDLVRSVTVPVAPVSKQRAFARAVDAIEHATGPVQTSLLELEHLFASLQHRAFRGEL